MRVALAFLIAGLLAAEPARAADEWYAPKVSFRTSSGLLKNAGSAGGSSTTFGSWNFTASYFLGPRVSVGLGYVVAIDYAKQIVPLYGWDLTSRFYFMGQGTVSRITYLEGVSERHDPVAAYLGLDFSQRSYYLGGNTNSSSTTTLTGSFLTTAASLGVDVRLSRHFEVNVEANIGLISFASSDDRFRIVSRVGTAGLSYVF